MRVSQNRNSFSTYVLTAFMPAAVLWAVFMANAASLNYHRRNPGCVLVMENRPAQVDAIANTILAAMPFVPRTWPFIVHVTGEMERVLHDKPALKRFIFRNKIKISTQFERSMLTYNDYQRLLTSFEFWRNGTAGTHVLVMQTDTCFCAHATSTIEDFLQYDYIGAPWSHAVSHGIGAVDDVAHAGNGGFSLRKRTAVMRLTKTYESQFVSGMREDVWFQMYGKKENFTFAPPHIARAFSVESIPHASPLGIHKAYLFLKGNDLRRLINACPNMKMLMK